ncbi:MAG TPA: acyltransferase [Hyphomicrobiaceae bacterium]|nr:acyltransferase [Hyphomicrobiaceae bacterium]
MVLRVLRAVCRLLANHCIALKPRMALFRASGIRIGNGAVVNMDVKFVDDYETGLIEIGDRAAVAPGATFVAVSHPNHSRLSRLGSLSTSAKIVVRPDAWIGVNAIVLAGLTIGRGAVVGAGAVVTRDVPDLAVVQGVPAKVVRQIELDLDE